MKKVISYLVTHIPRKYLIRFSRIFGFLITPFYLGHKHKCPICNGSFRKFLPYGNKGSDNRLCPKCLSLERHRLLWIYLNSYSNMLITPSKVLHIAPEQPFLKRFKKNKLWTYVTADLESPIADIKMDIRQMPFQNEEFDLIICNHVLEHIDNDTLAMQELFRVLKKGGKAILQVPIDYNREVTYEDESITDPKEREKHFGQYDHVRVYGTDYPKRLEKVGFRVTVEKFVQNINPSDIQKYRLDPHEWIYIAEKP
ncbi:MAG: class I SAM-dependent methyltransferase [Bacteroidales bacterium]|nr:class I SAM-dependent methyltransferase [Bacteroidales bacterium]